MGRGIVNSLATDNSTDLLMPNLVTRRMPVLRKFLDVFELDVCVTAATALETRKNDLLLKSKYHHYCRTRKLEALAEDQEQRDFVLPNFEDYI